MISVRRSILAGQALAAATWSPVTIDPSAQPEWDNGDPAMAFTQMSGTTHEHAL